MPQGASNLLIFIAINGMKMRVRIAALQVEKMQK